MFWAYRENVIDLYFDKTVRFYLKHKPFEIWLDRLVVMGVIEREDWDRENGKYADIPKCCIEWYISLSKLGIEHICEFMDNLIGAESWKDGYDYVRCLKCRLKGV